MYETILSAQMLNNEEVFTGELKNDGFFQVQTSQSYSKYSRSSNNVVLFKVILLQH